MRKAVPALGIVHAEAYEKILRDLPLPEMLSNDKEDKNARV